MKYEECLNCPLSGRPRVWAEGPEEAAIVFVGMNPGATEVRTRRPFTGDAGIRLDKVFDPLPIAREGVLVTNAAKCYTPTGEPPSLEAYTHCWPFLEAELVDAKFIIPLGKDAASVIKKFYKGEARIFEMIHPSAALRRAKYEARLRLQTKQLKAILNTEEKDLWRKEKVGKASRRR